MVHHNTKLFVYKHVVPEGVINSRLRPYAQATFTTFFPTNKSIKKAIDKGLFFVNGLEANTATPVNGMDVIDIYEVEFDPETAYPFLLEIVFEDNYFAVIHKPAGIPVHNLYKRNIVNALPYNIKKSTENDALPRPMPVHRLDAATSGLLIVAKTRTFQAKIGQLFENRALAKTYLAIVLGKLEGSGIFRNEIDKKEAITHYQAIRQLNHAVSGWLSLVKLFPVTGRTHQLRIHCADAGFPILGERLYGERENLKGNGLFLCACKLEFIHPKTHKNMVFQIDPPKKFMRYFEIV